MPPVSPRRLLSIAAAALVLAPSASAAPHTLVVGAAEATSQVPDIAGAKAKMDLAQLAGLGAIRLAATWPAGQTQPDPEALVGLKNAVAAADLDAIQTIVALDHGGAKSTPTTPLARAQFAAWAGNLARELPTVRTFIVGNEPNLNRFWMPQFGGRGADAAAPAYEALLAKTYDALKTASPSIQVIGGALSPHGADKPRAPRQTHSPTRFLLDLAQAYRRSRRAKPIMDAFALHPYNDSSLTPPTVAHPHSTTITLADYQKLVALLKTAFRGTAQPGARLPIVYAEYGIQTQIPSDKLSAYTDLGALGAFDAVPEAVQGAYYSKAIRMAFCQPTVRTLLFFHVSDEADLDRWQSGLFYADDTPKSDLPTVKLAVNAARAGTLTCKRFPAKTRR
jgi:hypothetical protein